MRLLMALQTYIALIRCLAVLWDDVERHAGGSCCTFVQLCDLVRSLPLDAFGRSVERLLDKLQVFVEPTIGGHRASAGAPVRLSKGRDSRRYSPPPAVVKVKSPE